MQRLQALPGVRSVGAVSRLPLAGGIVGAASKFRELTKIQRGHSRQHDRLFSDDGDSVNEGAEFQ